MLTVVGINTKANTALIALWQAAGKFVPGSAAIDAFPDTGIVAGDQAFLVVSNTIPCGGIQGVWIIGGYHKVYDTGFIGNEQGRLPVGRCCSAFIEPSIVVALEGQPHGGGVQLV